MKKKWQGFLKAVYRKMNNKIDDEKIYDSEIVEETYSTLFPDIRSLNMEKIIDIHNHLTWRLSALENIRADLFSI